MLEYNYGLAVNVFDKYVGVAIDEVSFPEGALLRKWSSRIFVLGKGFFFTKPAGPSRSAKAGIGSWDSVLHCETHQHQRDAQDYV